MNFVISLKWTTHSDGALDVGGEGALKKFKSESWQKKNSHLFSLLVPLLHPSCRADGFEVLQEELARLVLLTLQIAINNITSCKANFITVCIAYDATMIIPNKLLVISSYLPTLIFWQRWKST